MTSRSTIGTSACPSPWRNIASPNVAIWTHIIRRRERAYPEGTFPPGFAADLNERYRSRIAGERLMVNEPFCRHRVSLDDLSGDQLDLKSSIADRCVRR